MSRQLRISHPSIVSRVFCTLLAVLNPLKHVDRKGFSPICRKHRKRPRPVKTSRKETASTGGGGVMSHGQLCTEADGRQVTLEYKDRYGNSQKEALQRFRKAGSTRDLRQRAGRALLWTKIQRQSLMSVSVEPPRNLIYQQGPRQATTCGDHFPGLVLIGGLTPGCP